MDVAQIITIILIITSIILALIIIFKDDKKNSILYSFIAIAFITMGWMTVGNNEVIINEEVDSESEGAEVTDLSPISKKLETDIDKNSFKVGTDLNAGRYSIMSLNASEETIFFVWNENGDKIVSEVIGGENGVPLYSITLLDGMKIAAWNSSGLELMSNQSIDTIIEGGIYEVGEDLVSGKYSVRNMTDEDGEGLIQVFDDVGVNILTVEDNEVIKEIELDEGYVVKITKQAVAKLTYLPEKQELKLNTDNDN